MEAWALSLLKGTSMQTLHQRHCLNQNKRVFIVLVKKAEARYLSSVTKPALFTDQVFRTARSVVFLLSWLKSQRDWWGLEAWTLSLLKGTSMQTLHQRHCLNQDKRVFIAFVKKSRGPLFIFVH
jgi:hypothetical protein